MQSVANGHRMRQSGLHVPGGPCNKIPQSQKGEDCVIEFDDVAYGDPGRLLCSQITLRMARGAFHVLTGPSGAGMTTFVKLCYGALRPTRGRVCLFGTDLATLDRNRLAAIRGRIGVVEQQCALVDHLSVLDNVALPLVVAGRDPAQALGDLRDLLDWVGLSGRADAAPAELSAGERQRAGLARALILSPDLILADAPTANADAEMSGRVLRLLMGLNRVGKTVLVATRDAQFVEAARTDSAAQLWQIGRGGIHPAGTGP